MFKVDVFDEEYGEIGYMEVNYLPVAGMYLDFYAHINVRKSVIFLVKKVIGHEGSYIRVYGEISDKG